MSLLRCSHQLGRSFARCLSSSSRCATHPLHPTQPLDPPIDAAHSPISSDPHPAPGAPATPYTSPFDSHAPPTASTSQASTSQAGKYPHSQAPPSPSTTHFGFKDVPEQLKEALVKGVFSSVASSISTSSSSSSSPRIVAAALISRPPLLLPSLTPFERTYYAYQRRIARALAKPVSVSTSWFFKPNSTTEKSFSAYDQATTAVDTGLEDPMRDFELAGEQVEGAAELVPRQTEADQNGDLKSLERKGDRTLYMLLKKDRETHAWQFPQGGVEGDESLLEAAQRELVEETGPNMDVWPIGKVPAGAYSYPFPEEHLQNKPEHTEARVFFLPMRIVRGQAVPNKNEGLVDFAWLTKEEIREKVSQGYWEAVEPMLSDI